MPNESAKVGGELHDVVIVGGGAAGIATAASLLKRRPDLDILDSLGRQGRLDRGQPRHLATHAFRQCLRAR